MAARLYLRAGGKLRQWRADADGIANAFAALPRRGAATLAATGNGAEGLWARRDANGMYSFRVVDAALGHRVSARRDLDAAGARRLLALYAAGDPAWRTEIAWKRGLLDLPVAILAPATILICVVGYFLIAGATGGLQG